MSQAGLSEYLEKGRKAYADCAWADAYLALADADRAAPLEPDDLELLATSASMTGRIDEYLTVLERIHHRYLDAGEGLLRRGRRSGPARRLRLVAISGRRAAGSLGRSASSTGRESTASSQAICSSPRCTSSSRRASMTRRTPWRVRAARSATGSTTGRSRRLGSCSRERPACTRGWPSRASASWTRQWSRSPRARCPRS